MEQSSHLYAVTGKPIRHSLSPVIHNTLLAAATVEDMYFRLAADSLNEAITVAKQVGVRGLNLTSPFKTEAAPALERCDKAAATLNAVNTVLLSNDRLQGYNTDGVGVTESLRTAGVSLPNARCLVLGSGGAAAAAAFALLEAGAQVCLASRDERKTYALMVQLGISQPRLTQLRLNEVNNAEVLKRFNVIISCLAAPVAVIDEANLDTSHVVLDAYYATPTPLVHCARLKGCRVVDPREWLIYQALSAFSIFTGHTATPDVGREALYDCDKPCPQGIALVGLMGSGKSTVAQAIANRCNRELIDLDDEIESLAGRRITEIFSSDGERHFRKLEHEALTRASISSNTVIACGGGTVLDPRNRALLKQSFTTVWLWSPLDTLIARVGNRSERPLLEGANPTAILASFGKLLADRLMLYAQSCDFMLSTEHRSPIDSADRILWECGLNS